MKKTLAACVSLAVLGGCTTTNPYTNESQISRTAAGTGIGAGVGALGGLLVGEIAGVDLSLIHI